jgi:PAS domain S-box-containing protein/putative nucleotidyltransferase with HDIG domain
MGYWESLKANMWSGAAARIAAAYALFASLWILLSDRVLQILVEDADQLSWLQTLKGIAFIALSAGIIYILLKREFTKVQEATRSLRAWADIFRYAHTGTVVSTAEGIHFHVVNPAFSEMLGYSEQEMVGMAVVNVIAPEDRPAMIRHRGLVQEHEFHSSEMFLIRKDGSIFPALVDTSLVKGEHGEGVFQVSSVRDITERRSVEAHLRVQLDRLAALRKVDMTITSTLDLRVTFDVLLEQVVSTLGVDAAAILLYNPELQVLEYAGARGFTTNLIQQSSIPLGKGLAGKTAAQMKVLVVPSLEESEDHPLRQDMLAQEGFIAYLGMPLVAKGEIKGVLEIFHRSRLPANPDWHQYLEALAIQAAIATDNMKLYEDLQRNTQELSLAYDATLAGWSRAMELRDQETDGHSQRVTELATQLARKLGVQNSDLMHLRRGTLLHDIGKMGVPDSILFKPGPLSSEEWDTMRMHPIYAFEMLAPISFLRPALDIPYSHHERWDGSGYPRGLKGTQIPLSARIFAVVDVWDALRSDRPYRPAWPVTRVRQYLRERAGKHFDPEVVAAFLEMMPDE